MNKGEYELIIKARNLVCPELANPIGEVSLEEANLLQKINACLIEYDELLEKEKISLEIRAEAFAVLALTCVSYSRNKERCFSYILAQYPNLSNLIKDNHLVHELVEKLEKGDSDGKK